MAMGLVEAPARGCAAKQPSCQSVGVLGNHVYVDDWRVIELTQARSRKGSIVGDCDSDSCWRTEVKLRGFELTASQGFYGRAQDY